MALALVKLEGTYGPIIKLENGQEIICTIQTIRETEMPSGKATLIDCVTHDDNPFSLYGHTMLMNAIRNDAIPLPQIYLICRTGVGENKRGNAPILYEISRVDMSWDQIKADNSGENIIVMTSDLYNDAITA